MGWGPVDIRFQAPKLYDFKLPPYTFETGGGDLHNLNTLRENGGIWVPQCKTLKKPILPQFALKMTQNITNSPENDKNQTSRTQRVVEGCLRLVFAAI